MFTWECEQCGKTRRRRAQPRYWICRDCRVENRQPRPTRVEALEETEDVLSPYMLPGDGEPLKE